MPSREDGTGAKEGCVSDEAEIDGRRVRFEVGDVLRVATTYQG
jgi:hypothetical protein